jgi:hypothetical protein
MIDREYIKEIIASTPKEMTRAQFRAMCLLDINQGHREEVEEAERQLFGTEQKDFTSF